MSCPVPPTRARLASVLGAAMLLTSACGDVTTPRDVARDPSASAAAAALAAAPTLTVAGVGGAVVPGVELPLTVTLKDPAAPLPNASLTWHTSNAAVAMVSEAGVVTAVAPGTATITATLGAANRGPSGAVAITVTEGGLASPAGGIVSGYAGNVTLVLPPGALTESTPITVDLAPSAPTTPYTIGTAYELGPSGTQFPVPVEIALKYNPAALPPNTDEADLRVARYEDGVWVPLTEGVSVDVATKTVRAATRHFSWYRIVRRDPCAYNGLQGTLTGTYTGTITASDCQFVASQRYADRFYFAPSANTVTVIKSTGDFSGEFGMTESVAYFQESLVFGSTKLGSELRIVGNGDRWQLFVSGTTLATTGSYTLTESAAVGHACPTAAPRLYLVAGATYRDAVTAQNSCEFLAEYSPYPEVNGKPLLTHYLYSKLDAGKQYTISVSGMPGQSALTIFRNGVAAQNVGPTVGGVRTVTVTPATAGYYAIEISSGGFEFANRTGNWLNPVINYTLSVSRGVTPTP
jgi:hypothetical protein